MNRVILGRLRVKQVKELTNLLIVLKHVDRFDTNPFTLNTKSQKILQYSCCVHELCQIY